MQHLQQFLFLIEKKHLQQFLFLIEKKLLYQNYKDKYFSFIVHLFFFSFFFWSDIKNCLFFILTNTSITLPTNYMTFYLYAAS